LGQWLHSWSVTLRDVLVIVAQASKIVVLLFDCEVGDWSHDQSTELLRMSCDFDAIARSRQTKSVVEVSISIAKDMLQSEGQMARLTILQASESDMAT
jgi:hypothetical protein